jgi:glycosyltransferase involved in cell wall biosynthesis
MVTVSVIIPTLNEAGYLPRLFDSLRKQTFKDFEVIIADSGSTDKTKDLAKKFNARYVTGPRMGPGEGRNRGARHAKGKLLLFCDADCVIPKNLVEEVVRASEQPGVTGGATAFYPLEGNAKDIFMFKLANWYSKFFAKFGKPHNPGYLFFYKKEVYDKVGGIREDLVMNETHDLTFRTLEYGKFVLLNTPVYTSLRRFKRFGYFNTVFKTYLPSTAYYYLTKKTPRAKFKHLPAR